MIEIISGNFYKKISDKLSTEIDISKLPLYGERYSKSFIIVPVNAGFSKRLIRTGSPIGPLDFQSLFVIL